MAERGANKTAEAIVVSKCPDVCKTPVGNSVVPVPYTLFADFSSAQNTSENVNFEGNSAFHDGSYLPNVTGNEAGKLGGVKTGVNKGIVNTLDKSSSVKINGEWAIRNVDEVEMNSFAPNEKGNTIGGVIYCSTGSETVSTEAEILISAEKSKKVYAFFLNTRFFEKKIYGKKWGPSGLAEQCAANCQVLCSVKVRGIYYDTPKMKHTFAGEKVGSKEFFEIWKKEGANRPIMVAIYKEDGTYNNVREGGGNHTVLICAYNEKKGLYRIGEANHIRKRYVKGFDRDPTDPRSSHARWVDEKEMALYNVVRSHQSYDKGSKTHIQ